MVYGVDLATEIAYTYRIPDNNNPGPPILDEIFYEERSSCVGAEGESEVEEGEEEEEDLDMDLRDQDSLNLQGRPRNANPVSPVSSILNAVCKIEEVNCSETSTITNLSGNTDDVESTLKERSPLYGNSGGDMKSDVCSTMEIDKEIDSYSLGETSLDKLNLRAKAKAMKANEKKIKELSNEDISGRGQNQKSGTNHKPQDAAIVSSSFTKKGEKGRRKRKNKKGDCKNEVYGVKTKGKGKGKGSRSFSSSQRTRTFLRNGKLNLF